MIKEYAVEFTAFKFIGIPFGNLTKRGVMRVQAENAYKARKIVEKSFRFYWFIKPTQTTAMRAKEINNE